MIVAEKKLTAKQQRFCDEYLIDLNATQAAIRAGYSEKTAKVIASETLTKPNVKAYIEKRMNEKEKKLIADQDEVLKYLTSVLRGDSESSVLARTEMGADNVIKKPPDEKERLKAAELLGKRYSLFNEKVDINGAIPVVIGGDDGLED
jgi:phage terminase small subunit